jgi:hypothetical protein
METNIKNTAKVCLGKSSLPSDLGRHLAKVYELAIVRYNEYRKLNEMTSDGTTEKDSTVLVAEIS